MGLLPQIHNNEVIIKLSTISSMVFGCVQYIMTADMAVIVVIYIYILYEGVTVHYVVFLDWRKFMS